MKCCLDSKGIDRSVWFILSIKNMPSLLFSTKIRFSLCLKHLNRNLHMSGIFQQDSIIADKTFVKAARF